MKLWQGISLLLLGVSGGFLGGRISTVSPVHAEESYTEVGNCLSTVPKSWGEFRGASAYGLAFKDEAGRIRFLRNPPCDNGVTPGNASPTVDLRVDRK